MREILFRGKRVDNGKWVSGSLFTRITNCYIFPLSVATEAHKTEVDPATVGQYTGLNANGKKIFEGDIVRGAVGDMIVFYGEIVGEGYGFQWKALDGKPCESMTGFIDEYEVVGNIHDNPELLEGAENDG